MTYKWLVVNLGYSWNYVNKNENTRYDLDIFNYCRYIAGGRTGVL